MQTRLWNRFTYWMERNFVRGAQYRLLLIAALIGLISIGGGAAVLVVGSGFEDLGSAAWWAFLRLSDPGYLGDDVGTVNRTISTILTVLGYVVFLGALVAVMTQWLNARMDRLESGLTPVARDDHLLVLGWTNRTDAIVRELLLSGLVRRFLRRHGTRDLHVVVMVEEVSAALAQDLRDAVGAVWDENKVTLRSGSPLRLEHLARVDHLNAAVVIVPASEFEAGGVARTDSFTIKTLLSLAGDPDLPAWTDPAEAESPDPSELPLVVAEIIDARKMRIAENAYPGPLEIVASDAIISRLLAQNIRHRGLSHAYNELLTHEEGAELYVREHPELDGLAFGELGGVFRDSILVGLARREGRGYAPYLNPPPDFRVRADDRFVHLAGSYESVTAPGELPERAWERGRPGTREPDGIRRKILILGWNYKVPALIREFGTYERETFEIRILSTVSAARRKKVLDRYGVGGERLRIDLAEGDYAELADLEEVEPGEHDAVVLVGSDRMPGEEESDARTIVGSLLLGELGLPDHGTQTILELLDAENVRLVEASRGEVIISPLIVSHMLAHVALRPELRAVFAELFTAGGAEITFEPLADYGLGGDGGGWVRFAEIQEAAHARGEIALGLRSGSRPGDFTLCPPAGSRHELRPGVQVVTLVTFV